jgi:hypothetical protein
MMEFGIQNNEDQARRIEGCFTALYDVIGRRCREVNDDGNTIALHGIARECGEWAARFRDLGPHRAGEPRNDAPPNASVAGLLEDAFTRDASGSLVLYALVVEILPPLLIVLRDTTMSISPPTRVGQRASEAAIFLVATLHSLTSLLRDRSPSLHLEEFAVQSRDKFHI